MEEYNIYSEFDINKHKETYKRYLEVIIDRNGVIMYATPSHVLKAIELASKELGKTKQEISDMCPPEFYFDYLNWLLSLTDSIAVWTDHTMGPNITNRHLGALKKLKLHGIYQGPLPNIGQQKGRFL